MKNDYKHLFGDSSSLTVKKERRPQTAVTLEIKNCEKECSYRLDEKNIKILIGCLQNYMDDWEDYRRYCKSFEYYKPWGGKDD